MIIKQMTFTGPNGATVTLGQTTLDGGDMYGYTLTTATVDPAPLVSSTTNLPLVTGGVVSGGRHGVRSVFVEGFVIARNADEANELRRELVAVFKDHGESETITLSYALEGVTRELSGIVSDGPTFSPAGGHYVQYSVGLVCADPIAKSPVLSDAMAGTAPGATITTTGDARVWPVIEVTALATTTVTAFRVGNTTSGIYFEVSGISLTGSGLVLIDMTPGKELVTLNGVSILDKVAVGSRFWYLNPGANSVYVTDQTTVGADNARATLYWHNGWVS